MLVNRMAMDAATLREFFGVLDTVPSMRDKRGAVDTGRMIGRVEFNDVSFSYDGQQPAVTGLNFSALPGETVALVGTSRGISARSSAVASA